MTEFADWSALPPKTQELTAVQRLNDRARAFLGVDANDLTSQALLYASVAELLYGTPVAEPLVLSGDITVNGLTMGTGLSNEPDSVSVGQNALESNVSGYENTAVGSHTLQSSISGGANSAFGGYALQSSTTGDDNTAIGDGALLLLTTGDDNTAVGQLAGKSITTGSYNTILGRGAQAGLTTGSRNIILATGTGNTTTPAVDSNDLLVIGDAVFKAANLANVADAAANRKLRIVIGNETLYLLGTSVAG